MTKRLLVRHCSSKFAPNPPLPVPSSPRTPAADTEYGPGDFKTNLPLARIKKIMKSDDDVRQQMISSEVPALFAKACELFVLDLTTRAWLHTDNNNRRTLQRSDVTAAIARNEMFDFLIDIVPREEVDNGEPQQRAYDFTDVCSMSFQLL